MTHASKILIIEDDPRMCASMEKLLSSQGYIVGNQASGKAAIDALTRESYDLVILDIVLTDGEGYPIIDFLCARGTWIPIIIITGYPSLDSEIKALRMGARDYLRKPIDTDELLIRVRNALEHKKLIDDYKQAMERIQQQNTFLKTVIESLPHPFCVLDAGSRRILMANPAKAKHLPECLTGNSEVSRLLDPVKRERKPVRIEHSHKDPDGNLRFFEIYGFPVLDENGNVIQVIEYDVDVTDRKCAENSLEASKEELNSILKSVPDIIYRLDSNGRITFITDSVRQYGYAPEELLGTDVMDIIYPEDRADALYRINERRTGERGTKSHQLRFLLKNRDDVSYRTFNISAEGLYNSEKPHTAAFTGTQGIARDISEWIELENQFQQAQKMQAIGTLAGGIAHDFNNLLMGIQGNVSILLLDINPKSSYYGHLKNIEYAVENGGELTKQLLGFAKGGKYEVKTINLNKLIKTHNQIFGRTKKEVKVRGTYDKDLWAVDADEGQFRQVLMNLYVNAWHAMPNGGELDICTENVILDENYTDPFNVDAGKYVKIAITDNGIGMDQETQSRIFDPFFTTKEIGKGAGLGLASVYGIIKNHKGIISVQSEKGKGTIFTIYLPASEKIIPEQPSISERLLNGSGTILLIDDEDLILEIGSKMLERMGYEVFAAKSGKEAVDIYSQNRDRILLVVLDLILPGMSGGEIYDSLSKINPDIKVLLSSGYSIDGEAAGLLKRGCNGFIQKPFNIKLLSKKIREILDA